ncbi:MAG: hypothetical protein H8F28_01910 [Fibrella sp.]|nr:hypothetical protein [Armatimonadota bacterium]
MEMQSESFDAVAYEVEAHLRALRHLVAETVFLSDAQNDALNVLKESLRTAELQASALRQSLLTGTEPVSVEDLQVDRSAQSELQALEERLGMGTTDLSRRAQERLEWMMDPDLPPGLSGEALLGEADPPRTWNIEVPPDDRYPPESDAGGALIPRVPVGPRPTREGGAAKTFAEAEEPPRNP